MNKSLLTQYFLRSGKIEGYSYLLLLLVAMPLKYIWDIAEWVKIIGMVHGVLFVIFMVIIFLMIKLVHKFVLDNLNNKVFLGIVLTFSFCFLYGISSSIILPTFFFF